MNRDPDEEARPGRRITKTTEDPLKPRWKASPNDCPMHKGTPLYIKVVGKHQRISDTGCPRCNPGLLFHAIIVNGEEPTKEMRDGPPYE